MVCAGFNLISMYKKLLSSSALVLLIGLAVSALGFVKEMLVAYHFGVSSQIDVFYLALSVPLYLVSLYGSSINATIMPAYLQAKAEQAQALFFSEMMGLNLLFLVLLSGVCVAYSVLLQPFFLHATPEKNQQIITIGLLLAPMIVVQGLTSYFDSILNAEKRSLINNLFSLFIPLGTIVLLSIQQIPAALLLTCGWYLGFGLRLAGQYLTLRRQIAFQWQRPRSALFYKHRPLIQDFFWIVFSSAILGLLPVISNYLAGYLGDGQVASLNYATKLVSTGLMLVGIIINSVLFPHIAEQIVKDSAHGIREGLKLAALSFVVFALLLLPLYFFVEPIVALVFERGRFSAESTVQVAYILKYLLLYIPFYVPCVLLSRLVVSLRISRIFVLGNLISLVLFFLSGAYWIVYLGKGIESLGWALMLVYLVSAVYLLTHIVLYRKRPQ